MKITMAQRAFLDRIAAGYGSSGNTNRTGDALAKLGLVTFQYEGASFYGKWQFTDAGREYHETHKIPRTGRLCP